MSHRLVSVAVAALAVAGAGAAVFPQHVATLAVLATATVAVVAAGFLLVLAGALLSARPAPWSGTSLLSTVPPLDPHGLRDARRDLAARRDGTIPPAVHHRLRVAADRRLAGLGLSLDDPGARHLLRGTTLDVLVRPPGVAEVAGDPAAAAVAAHRLLDDLDRLLPGGPR